MDIYWRKIRWICALCIVAVSVTLGAWYAKSHSRHQFQMISQLDEDEDYIYGMDEDSENYYLFRIRKDGEDEGFFSMAKETGGRTLGLLDLKADRKGNLYIYEITVDGNWERTRKISLCNFQSGTLEKRWDLDKTEGAYSYVGYVNTEDNRLYAAMEDAAGSTVYWYEMMPGGELEFYKTSPFPPDIDEKAVDNYLRLWGTDKDGSLYRIGDDGGKELVFKNDGTQIRQDYYVEDFQQDAIHIWAMTETEDEERLYEIPIGDGAPEARLCFDHKELSAAAGVEFDGERSVIQTGGEDRRVIDSLYKGKQWVTRAFVQVTGLCLGAGFGYFILISLVHGKKGGAPLWGKLVLIMIPAAAIGYGMVFQMIERHMDASFDKTKAILLSRAGRDFMMDMDMEKFIAKRSLEPYTKEDGQEMAFDKDIGNYQVYWDGVTEEMVGKTTAVPYLYFYKDGKFTSADGTYQVNLSLDKVLPPALLKGMDAAAEKKLDTYVTYSIDGEDLSSVLMPLKDDEGRVMGVMEVWDTDRGAYVEHVRNKKNLKQQVLTTGLGFFAVILAAMWLNMLPVGRLQSAVQDLAEGRLDTRVHIRGNSEIASIASSFNKMAEMVEFQMQEMESLQEKYVAFLPKEMFLPFGKKGIQGVEPGEQASLSSTVLAVNTGYPAGRRDGPKEDLLAYINKSLSMEIPVITGGNGVIFRFFEAGTESFFSGYKEGNALPAAVSIVQRSRKMPKEFGMYAGIDCGRMKFGILGSRGRCTVEVLEKENLSRPLEKLAQECLADVVITARAAENVGNFRTEYFSRVMGYVYIRDQDKLEMVYEVLTAGDEQNRRKKLMTEKEFQAGVRCFMAGQIQKARRHFIRVIDFNRNDGAARKYIRLCEERMERGQGEGTLCLKTY